MEFSWGRRRNWEVSETEESPKEIQKKEYEQKMREVAERERKKEIEERERQEREKEELERKKRFQEVKQENLDAQELERKQNTSELQGEKNIESARIKELGIKEITTDELKHLITGVSSLEVKGFIKHCSRLKEQNVELTEEDLSGWRVCYEDIKQLKRYYPELEKAEIIIEKLLEKKKEFENENGEKINESNKITKLTDKKQFEKPLEHENSEIIAERQIDELLSKSSEDFYKTKKEEKEFDKLAENDLNNILETERITCNQVEIKEFNRIKEISFKDGRAYLAGLLAADGHLESKDPYLTIASKEELFLKDYIAPLIEKQICRLPKPYWDKSAKVWKLRIYNRDLWTTFINDYRIPSGRKSTSILPPKELEPSERIWYSRGWFDGEGWIEVMTIYRSSKVYQYPRVGFKVKNQPIRDWLLNELIHHNIRAKGYNRQDGTYGLWINGVINCQTFLNTIGFLYPLRNIQLKELIQKNQGLKL
jgi:hypothetical protein